MNSSEFAELRAELEAIKRLMVFRLLSEGHSQAKIANALGTSQASVSRLMAPKTGKE